MYFYFRPGKVLAFINTLPFIGWIQTIFMFLCGRLIGHEIDKVRWAANPAKKEAQVWCRWCGAYKYTEIDNLYKEVQGSEKMVKRLSGIRPGFAMTVDNYPIREIEAGQTILFDDDEEDVVK